MPRSRSWGVRTLFVLVLAVAAWSRPEPAAAWYGCGWGFRPGFAFGVGPGVYGGWYGGSRFFASQSVYLGGPFGGFFSGGVRSTVIGGPGWCGPLGYPAFGYTNTFVPYGWGPYGLGYGGWGGCGYVPYAPVIVNPFPGAFAPVYGPAGIRPFLGVSAAPPGRFAAGLAAAGRPGLGVVAARGQAVGIVADAPRGGQGPAAVRTDGIVRAGSIVPSSTIVRASNGDARLRAAKLVATGDRHLKAAAADRTKLLAALDAYRRAADIAPDQADTFLRQAIALTAQGRLDAADKAVARAVAIDARLGAEPAAAVAARRELPPDPVFGERPDAGPDSLATRSRGILGRIFRDAAAAPVAGGIAGAADAGAEGNWIAAAWFDRVGDGMGVPVRAIAAR